MKYDLVNQMSYRSYIALDQTLNQRNDMAKCQVMPSLPIIYQQTNLFHLSVILCLSSPN